MAFRPIPDKSAHSVEKPKVKFHFITLIILTVIPAGVWLTVNKENINEAQEAWKKRQEEKVAIETLEQEIRHLKKQQQSLTYNGVESLKQIRERLRMKFPGETVIFFKETTPTVSEFALPEETAAPATSGSPSDSSSADSSASPNSSSQLNSMYDIPN